MPSIDELVQFVHAGQTSMLIATAFEGERICVQRRFEDQDVHILFSSDDKVPSIEALAEIIERHYTRLSYVVERSGERSTNLYDAFIYVAGQQGQSMIALSITRNCELSEPYAGRPNVRLSTQHLSF